MKIDSNWIMALIESQEPIKVVGNRVLSFWLDLAEKENDLKIYYTEGERNIKDFEEFILKSYGEFYDWLAKACLHEKDVFKLYPDAAVVIMDGMSIRESALLYKVLKEKGHNVKHEFNFSALPSDTEFFREKINKTISDFFVINDHNNIRLTGTEKYIWSYFPDAMLDKIKQGHTRISSPGEMYKIVEKIVLESVAKISAKRIIVTSDHGYLSTDPGMGSAVSEKVQKKCQEVFSSKRYIKMDNVEVEDLKDEGYIKEFNGHYIVKARYVWPAPGKYSNYIHGGLSLMECFTPVLEIEK